VSDSKSPSVRGHLYELDLVRVVTFACVIGVHVISQTTKDIPTDALLTLLHFTREVFFALSAFVLVYTSLDRHGRSLLLFTRRRFLFVLLPYVVWSAIYVGLYSAQHPGGTLADELLRFGRDLLTGTAWYHLYFLLVSLQIYLLLPLIVLLVKKTRGHRVALLIVSGAVQLVLTGFYMYHPSALGWLSSVQTEFFLSYQFFIVLGAVAADNSGAVLGWVRSHRRPIATIVVVTAVVTVSYYLVAVGTGKTTTKASDALQPILMVWSFVVAIGLLALGTLWADRRRPGLVSGAIRVGSDRSFGIFLAHPLVVALLLWAGDGWLAKHLPTPLPLTPVIYVLTVIGTVLVVELFRRGPFSLPLTGRPWRNRVAWQTERSRSSAMAQQR
jgi:peptidoglycan/LPS O-acetylase OafA/YrhL